MKSIQICIVTPRKTDLFNQLYGCLTVNARYLYYAILHIAPGDIECINVNNSLLYSFGFTKLRYAKQALDELVNFGLLTYGANQKQQIQSTVNIPDQTIFPDATIPRDDIIKELSARYKYAVEDREFQDILELCSVHGISEDEIRGTERDRTLPRLEEVIQSLETKRVLSAGEMVRIGMAHDANRFEDVRSHVKRLISKYNGSPDPMIKASALEEANSLGIPNHIISDSYYY